MLNYKYGIRIKNLTFYRRSTHTATGVVRLRLRAYYAYSYGRTWSKATGVSWLQLRACYRRDMRQGVS